MNKILLVTGGIGDFLQCLPFLFSSESQNFNIIVMSHQTSVKELLLDLKINFKEFYLFENISDQNKILNDLKKIGEIFHCPRSRYFEKSPFEFFKNTFKKPKLSVGIHLGGSEFSINIQNELNLPAKNLPIKIIENLSRFGYDLLVFGSQNELKKYKSEFPSNVSILECKSLVESFSYVSFCDLFIGSDSAFKTLSVMLKIPTMVWMGDYEDQFRDDNFINPYVNDGLMDVFRYKNLNYGLDYENGIYRTKIFIKNSLIPKNNKFWTTLFSSSYGPIILNSRDKGVSEDVVRTGYFEVEHVKLLISLTQYLLGRQRNVIIYDVGANIGTHTLALAKIDPNRIQIRAFEAQSKIFYMLCGTIALNGLGNVNCHNYAVGNKDLEFIEMNVPDYNGNYNYGGFEIKKIQKSDNQNMTKPFVENVQLMSLDAFDEAVDLLKIDVEGMEEDVLDGAIKIFERSKPICFVEYFKSDSERIFNFFKNRNYVGYATHQDLLAIPDAMDLQINGLSRIF